MRVKRGFTFTITSADLSFILNLCTAPPQTERLLHITASRTGVMVFQDPGVSAWQTEGY